MRFSIVLALVWFSLAAAAWGQYGEPRSASVIRPAGYGWRNHVVVPDGPCGHPMPVRADCYDHCCVRCGLRPICFLHRVGRMLDCLLPCNACCGLLGGPVGGGCCGHGAIGCATPAPYGGPMYGDSLLGDPLPQPRIPTPTPETEVRRMPHRPAPTPARSSAPEPVHHPTPWKITHQSAEPAGHASPEHRTGSPKPQAAARQPAPQQPAEQSVLRRASAEEAVAPAPLRIDSVQARPIVRSQSPDASDSFGPIPHNPLRK